MADNTILDSIGNTPLVRLNNMMQDIPGSVYVKVEGANPGHSAKDRIVKYMIDNAEKEGKLKPGATLVEASSGNTGFSLAMLAAVRGYKCVITVKDTISDEKVKMLEALGAKLVMCPAGAKPESPESYYTQAERLAGEIENAFYVNQNFCLGNKMAYYHSLGPEIWEQSEGKITHYVCAAGTGGTISGPAEYLKEKNPDIKIIAIDAYGSLLTKYFETGILDENELYRYKIEGTGKNIITSNQNFEVIDQFVKVTDKDAALRARELLKKEGIFAGYSSGGNLQGVVEIKDSLKESDYIVVLMHDHGSRYLSKIFNDEWMYAQGFLERPKPSTNGFAKKMKQFH